MANGGENIVKTRAAKTRTEVDFLPPYGEPEVVTTGNGALDVAIAAVIASATVAKLVAD